jgi:DNA repair photolyase
MIHRSALKVVQVPSIQDPIKPSPGFAKKLLSDYKLDVLGLCGFGCRYCSSNLGNYLRIRQAEFAKQTEEQLGERLLPAEDPGLTFEWSDIVTNLEKQLASKPKGWGRGQTLVFSMLTDGFSPRMVASGTTKNALELLLEKTSFRVRVLTKSAAVGCSEWISFFARNRERFVVGLSIGTLDDSWAKSIEVGTSPPTARLRALHRLQDAGVPTFGMLCPAFPDLIESDGVGQLVDEIRPELVEHVWAEPFNDRANWKAVRAGYSDASFGYEWFTRVYEQGQKREWSRYATDLYTQLRVRAERAGWLHKLRYLLYELEITERDSEHFRGLRGVLLQSKGDAVTGLSQNPFIRRVQERS